MQLFLVHVIEDEPCTSDGLHEVELLLPLMKDVSRCKQLKGDCQGSLPYWLYGERGMTADGGSETNDDISTGALQPL
ncbi:hypothetical protein Ancab_016700, partial [Ancistrocladus abbreviatus]